MDPGACPGPDPGFAGVTLEETFYEIIKKVPQKCPFLQDHLNFLPNSAQPAGPKTRGAENHAIGFSPAGSSLNLNVA